MRYLIFIFVLLLSPPALAQESYLEALRDMPLMQGLNEISDETFVFDKPNGRIVQSTAAGETDLAQTQNFYARVLPQLGWVPQPETDKNFYVRENETLRLEFETKGNMTYVRFNLSPL